MSMTLREALLEVLDRIEGYRMAGDYPHLGRVKDREWLANAILTNPIFREALERGVTRALVDLEEDRGLLCIIGECDHPNDECPEIVIGCADGVGIADKVLDA